MACIAQYKPSQYSLVHPSTRYIKIMCPVIVMLRYVLVDTVRIDNFDCSSNHEITRKRWTRLLFKTCPIP